MACPEEDRRREEAPYALELVAKAAAGRGERDLTSGVSQIDISVVICTYTEERWDDLERAVGSVQRQTLPPAEVVLSIDHNPALLSRVRTRWPEVVVVGNKGRRGLSGARNAGVAAARGDVIAFLDDDAVADMNWLEEMVRAYEESSVLGVGGAIGGEWTSGQPVWFPDEFGWVVGCDYLGLPTTATPVRNVFGANMSFRRAVFEAIGGFREEVGRLGTLPAGCEETELCIRAHRRWPDGVILYDPAVRVRHRVPGERARWRYFVSRCYAEGRSKAVVVDLSGYRDALSSEVSYTSEVLPHGVLRELRRGVGRADARALARAGTIVVGLVVAGVGFVTGRAASAAKSRRGAVPHASG